VPPLAALVPPGGTDTAAERRNRELAECGRQIQALLTQYGANFAIQQTMTLDAEARPRYSYSVNIVGA
jgi:hypothetical protein